MLFEKFENIVEKNKELFEGKFLLGVSGGLDSVILVDLFNKKRLCFSIAHCNFSLRGEESDEDEWFVEELSKKYKVDFFSKKFIPQNGNIQVWARDSRYKWFEEIRKENNFSKIVVAHHLDDNLETFFINLTRGTGLEGLTGMDFFSNNIIRPLLYFSREEILEYARRNNILWREDSSNKNTKYFRNKLRHDIIPIFKNLNNNFLKSFQKTIQNLSVVNDFYLEKIKDDAENFKEKYENSLFCLDIKRIKNSKNSKLILYNILKDYGFSNMLEDIILSFDGVSGKEFITKKYKLLKDREKLILSEIKEKSELEEYFIHENTKSIEFPLKMEFYIEDDFIEYSEDVVYFDFDKLEFPLKIRKPREGEYFQPLGMKGKKKLSKFFKDEKMSNLEKENSWILCSGTNIILIIGKRQSDIVKIEDKTKKYYLCKF